MINTFHPLKLEQLTCCAVEERQCGVHQESQSVRQQQSWRGLGVFSLATAGREVMQCVLRTPERNAAGIH